jgi:hypothetical protein
MEQIMSRQRSRRRGQPLNPEEREALRVIVASVAETGGASSRRHVVAARWGVSHQTIGKAMDGGNLDPHQFNIIRQRIMQEIPQGPPPLPEDAVNPRRYYLRLMLPNASPEKIEKIEQLIGIVESD